MAESTKSEPTPQKLILTVTYAIQALSAVGFVLFALRRNWENAFLTASVIALTLLPALLSCRYHIVIPPEFQVISAAFVFLSLFLESAADYYYRYWWSDIVMHRGSGFLLGVVGFNAMILLNQTDRIPRGMKPGFLCFFAVTFAAFHGVWEVFEFIVDQIAPAVNMQSNETGVRDTMHDLIVDTLGAVIVAVMGWVYLRTGCYSFIADGVRSFIQRNSHLIRQEPLTDGTAP